MNKASVGQYITVMAKTEDYIWPIRNNSSMVLAVGLDVGKVAEDANGSDVVSDGELSALVACDRERQSNFVLYVVVAGQ